MKTKPIIAIDIDDVIAANAPAFIEFSNQRFGTHLTADDYHEHWTELWKVDHAETERRSDEFHKSGHVSTYKVIEGAAEALKQLKGRFKLIALTARRSSISQLTKDWLERYYPGIFDEVVFSGFFDSSREGSTKLTKGELAKNVGADYLIDDQLKHVLAAAEIGINSILFGDYTWNRVDVLPANIIRVKNWQEVIGYFDDL